MIKVIVQVSGGIVQSVFASSNDIDVWVLDEDNAKEETDTEQLAEYDSLREEIKGMKEVL